MGLAVYSVHSDGDCLYSALSPQLSSRLKIGKKQIELRQLAANFITNNQQDFCGFLEMDVDSYCNKVIYKFFYRITKKVTFILSWKLCAIYFWNSRAAPGVL